jgi:hypothetical protein
MVRLLVVRQAHPDQRRAARPRAPAPLREVRLFVLMRRPDAKFVTRLRHGERVVAMITFKNQVLVATEQRVYRLRGNHLVPFLFGSKC